MGDGSNKRRNDVHKAKSLSSDAIKQTTEITNVLFPLLKQESQGRSNKMMSLTMSEKKIFFYFNDYACFTHTHIPLTHTIK